MHMYKPRFLSTSEIQHKKNNFAVFLKKVRLIEKRKKLFFFATGLSTILCLQQLLKMTKWSASQGRVCRTVLGMFRLGHICPYSRTSLPWAVQSILPPGLLIPGGLSDPAESESRVSSNLNGSRLSFSHGLFHRLHQVLSIMDQHLRGLLEREKTAGDIIQSREVLLPSHLNGGIQQHRATLPQDHSAKYRQQVTK